MHGPAYSAANWQVQSDGRGGTRYRGARRQRERGAAEWSGIDAEHEVVHDRVADDHDVENPISPDVDGGDQLADQLVDRLAHRSGELLVAALVHHHVGDTAHQVLAEADLRVHPPPAGEHVTAEQTAEVAGDGRRADVDRHPEGLVDVSRPDRHDASVANGRRRRAAGDRRVDERQHLGGQGVDDVAVLLGDGGDHEVGRRQPGAERRRSDLDVAQREHGVDHELGQVEGAEFLAHDLAVHLARRRHVDDGVTVDRRRATEAVSGVQLAAARGSHARGPTIRRAPGRWW